MMVTVQFKPVPAVDFLVAPKTFLFNACTSKVISVIFFIANSWPPNVNPRMAENVSILILL